MEDIVKGQMSMDDISTGTNTQQSTAAAQNATSQDRAHDCKQRIAESVQTPSESAGRNDTALQFANRPKTATQNDFHRNFPQEQRNNNGKAEHITQMHNVAANDNEYSASGTESCERAAVTAEPNRRHRKVQRNNMSPISDMQMLTPDDIMQALRLSRSTVYNMLKRGEIPTVKIGNMLRVNKSDFEHWLEQHTTAAHAV